MTDPVAAAGLAAVTLAALGMSAERVAGSGTEPVPA
jgi:hypothetical protein